MPLKHFKLHLVFKDVARTKLMQAADVFEPFKVLMADEIVLDVDASRDVSESISKIRKQFDIDKRRWELIAIWRPEDTDGAWRDENVKVLSTGESWMMFDEWLKVKGFCSE